MMLNTGYESHPENLSKCLSYLVTYEIYSVATSLLAACDLSAFKLSLKCFSGQQGLGCKYFLNEDSQSQLLKLPLGSTANGSATHAGLLLGFFKVRVSYKVSVKWLKLEE